MASSQALRANKERARVGGDGGGGRRLTTTDDDLFSMATKSDNKIVKGGYLAATILDLNIDVRRRVV